MLAGVDTFQWVTLDDVASNTANSIVDGPFGSNLKLSDYVDTGIPVLQGKNITDDVFRWSDVRFISERKAEELKRSSVREGDILIVKIGSIGYSAILDDLRGYPFAIIPANLAKITPDSSVVDTRFLHRWLTSSEVKRRLIESASKTAQPALNLEKLRRLPVPLSPLPEQRRIAALFDRADALRAKRQTASGQLTDLVQAIFFEMFGDPEDRSTRWRRVPLRTITTKIGSGATPLGGDAAYKTEGISLIRSMNVRDGEFSLKDLACVDDQQAARLANVEVKSGDVLLNITGASVARVCQVPDAVLPARVNQHVCIIRVGDSLLPSFLEQLLLFPSMKRRLLTLGEGGGATRQALTKSQLESLKIPVPPISDQTRFVVRVESIGNLRSVQSQFARQMDSLFASLHRRVFSGGI